MKCKRCGTELRDDALYCHVCGQAKDGPLKCPKCGAELLENQKFCPSCGTNILDTINLNAKENVNETNSNRNETNSNTNSSEYSNNSNIGTAERNPNDISNIDIMDGTWLPKGKDKIVAVILAIIPITGGLGIHNFYLGENKKGIAKILLTLCFGIGIVIALIDAVRMIVNKYKVDYNKFF